MELVQFKARCHKCQEKLRITLDQARADQSIVCSQGHTIRARAAIESKLINGLNQGSRYYFERLVDIFDWEIRAIVRRCLVPWLGSDLAALETEDAVQEVYLDLWQQGIGKVKKSLTVYVRGIALHKTMDRMRKRGDTHFVPFDSILESASFDLTEEQLVLALDEKRQLELRNQALSTLPQDQQDVYRLRRIELKSTAEVAKLLSILPGTVKSRLSRAEEGIRRFLLAAVPVRSIES